ncbi:MAG: cupin domain-containing protein [Sphingobacteriales bacterium]|nr:cupin domain-containing protein [Sphingobacteriales bacterium]
MATISATELVQQFNMLPHPEGGYYKETYRCKEEIKTESGSRNISTAIYFLLEQGNFSAFHKIKSDECWHFYAGASLNIYIINSNGSMEIIKLGNNITNGETFQYIVPAGYWFASEPAINTAFSFVGCTVAPGFDFADFELAKAAELTKIYPGHKEIIKKLCRQ